MPRYKWLVAAAVVLVLAVVQLAWHSAIDQDNGVSRWVLSIYLTAASDRKYGQAAVAPFVDLVLPALAAGIAFGWFGRPTKSADLWLFCPAVGLVLSLLHLCYRQLVSYELWWVTSGPTPEARLLAFYAVAGAGFSWAGAVGLYLKWKNAAGGPPPLARSE